MELSLATTTAPKSSAGEHRAQLYLSGKQQQVSVALSTNDSKTTEDTIEQQQYSGFSTNDLLKLTSDLKLTDDHLCASGTDQQLLSTNRMLIATATNEHQENEQQQQKVETLTNLNEQQQQQQHFINNNNYVDQHYFQHYDQFHHHHHHLPRFHHQVVNSATAIGGQFTPLPDQQQQYNQQQQQQQTFLNDPMDFLELASFPHGHAFSVGDEACLNYCHSGQPEVLRVEHRNRQQQHMSNLHFYPQTDSGHASSANSSTGNTAAALHTGSLLSLTAARHAHSAAGLVPTPQASNGNYNVQCLDEPIDASLVVENLSAGNLTKLPASSSTTATTNTTTTATTAATIIPSMSSTASCPLNVTATTTSCFSNSDDHELIVSHTVNTGSYSTPEQSANHYHHHHHHFHQLQVEPELKVCEWEGCGNTFLDMLAFVKHLEERHVNEVPKVKNRYYCLWANCKRNEQEFNARYKLLIHMRVHSGEKPYPCNNVNCKKSFSRLENLKIHVRSHTGEKPYKCSYETCSKSFTNSSDRIKHHKTHKDPKPYSCNYNGCPKRYTDPSSLRKHLRAHKKATTTTTTTQLLPTTSVTCATQSNTQNYHLSADFDPTALLLLPPSQCSADEQEATSSSLSAAAAANNYNSSDLLSHSQLSRSWCVGHHQQHHQQQQQQQQQQPTQLTWRASEAHEALNRSLPAPTVQWRSESFLTAAADLSSRAAYEP